MKPILSHDNNPRINAVIRSFLFLILFIGLLVGSGWLSNVFPPQWVRFMYGVFGTLSALLVTWLFLRVEKKPFAQTGLVWRQGTIPRFIQGIAIGIVIFGFILLALLSTGNLYLQKSPAPINASYIIAYLVFVPLALMEELAFRGYPFVKLNKAFGLRATQIILAVAFALYHVLNGWSVYVAFTGPFVWAFVFGLAAAYSGGIAMPTGIHVALNVLQVLAGMHGGADAIWQLNYKAGTSKAAMALTENVGLVSQAVVLICAVVFTEYFIRKKAAGETQRPHS